MSTPNMNLDLPTPEETIGPDWAEDLNTALETIDAHDHSDGKGPKVTPAGININNDLPFNNVNATEVRMVRFENQASAPAEAEDLKGVYVYGNNLYYKNSAGVAVQLTSGNAIASTGTGEMTISVPGAYPYAVDSGDAQKVLIIDTTAARTLTLPAATTAMYFVVKDKNGLAATNNITVTPDGTDTIDEVNDDYLLDTGLGSWGFISDGVSAWYVV